jgi:hypothetical protein
MEIGRFRPDNLLVGGPFFTDNTVVQAGQKLPRGAVLSKVKFSCPTTGAAGANTGNGTVTLVRGGKNVKYGTYTILCLKVVASAYAEFRVIGPNSEVLGNCMVGVASTETGDFANDQIKLRITSGTTAFVANDSFTIAVTEGCPDTGTADGGNTGNGTLIQVEPRPSLKKGAYNVECTEAIANGGKFKVVDPDGVIVGYAYASKFIGTGNGTVTEIKAGPEFKNNGPYLIKCTTAVANGGVFTVFDPDGVSLGTVTITPGAGASAVFWHEQISFRITDGSTDTLVDSVFTLYFFENNHIAFVIWDATDFVVGDKFAITTTIAQGESKLVNKDNTDGSNIPEMILAEAVDATTVPKNAPVYIGGVFDERSLYFGGDDTIETHRLAMKENGIYTQRTIKGN